MFILTETSNNIRAISLSLVINWKGKRVLLLAQGSTISVHFCQEKSLEFVTTWSLNNNLRSWAKFSRDGEPYVIFIDSAYEIKLIEFTSLHKKQSQSAIRVVAKLSTKGQRVSPNLDAPIIIPEREVDPEFIIFHIFYSNVQVFSVRNILDTSKEFAPPNTRSIGQIDIKQIVRLSEGGGAAEGALNQSNFCTLAVLYKDITSSYYIRYLEWSNTTSTLNISRQLASFEEEPSLIQPCLQQPFGLIVYTSSSMFYFPPERFRHISIARQMKNVFVSTKTHDAYLMMTLNKPGRGKNKMTYKCFEPIDKQRTLLTTTTGKTVLLYMDLEASTNSSLVVNQINIIDLDFTTIPNFNGLHHINGNLFFQASKTSKSVLFEVLPSRPNISILDTIEGNPPIIDLKEVSKDEFFACQGGWDGSQLRKYTAPRCKYSLKREAKISDGPLKVIGDLGDRLLFGSELENLEIEVHAVDSEFTKVPIEDFTETDILMVSKVKSQDVVITKRGLKINGSFKFESEIKFGTIHAEEGLVLMSTANNEVHVFDFSKSLDGIHCNPENYQGGVNEISSADVFKDGDSCWIICCLLSGKYDIWNVNSQGNFLMYQGKSDRAAFSTCIFVESSEESRKTTVYTFLSFTNGDFEQAQFHLSKGKLIQTKLISENVSDIPYVWKRKNNHIIGLNSEGLVVPRKQKELNQFVLTKIDRTNAVDVHFCTLGSDITEAKTENAIVLFDDGAVEELKVYFEEVTDMKEFESVYSDKLFVKSLPVEAGKYVVVVAYDKSSTPGEIRTELLLINSKTLAIHDVFKFHDDTEVVDLCELTDLQFILFDLDPFTGFMCLPSSGKYPITIFKILDDKIRLFEKSHISGYQSLDEMKFTSMTYDSSDRSGDCLITGTLNFFCNLRNMKGARFEVSKIYPEAATSVGLTSTVGDNYYLIADAMSGVSYFKTVGLLNNRSFPISSSQEKYLTTMSHTMAKSFDDYHVIGYSSGNIYLVNVVSNVHPEGVKFVIDGDQINSTTGSIGQEGDTSRVARIGTLNGGIFTLTKIINTDWEQILQKCEPELKLYGSKKDFPVRKMEVIPDSTIGKPIPILDGRILFKFFGDEDPKNDLEFPNLVANKSVLQKIYSLCCI